MIGGVDTLIPTRAGDSSLIAAVRAIRQFWPAAVFENGLTGERYPSFWNIPFDNLVELFVYRDSQAADVWDAHGLVPEAQNLMIHLISEEGLVSVVVDDADDPLMRAVVAAIASSLRDELLNAAAEAELEAA